MKKHHRFLESTHTDARRFIRVASPHWREQLRLFVVYLLLAVSTIVLAGYALLVLRFSYTQHADFALLPIALLIMQPMLLAWYLTKSVRLGGSLASVLLVLMISISMMISFAIGIYRQ